MSELGIREQLVGCWRLVGYSVTAAEGGETDRPLGNSPLGTILYTPDGYMSAQLSRPGPSEDDQEPDGTTSRTPVPTTSTSRPGPSSVRYRVSVIPSWLATMQIRQVQVRESGHARVVHL